MTDKITFTFTSSMPRAKELFELATKARAVRRANFEEFTVRPFIKKVMDKCIEAASNGQFSYTEQNVDVTFRCNDEYTWFEEDVLSAFADLGMGVGFLTPVRNHDVNLWVNWRL